jgi:polyisoprenoid-binding protein YceI
MTNWFIPIFKHLQTVECQQHELSDRSLPAGMGELTMRGGAGRWIAIAALPLVLASLASAQAPSLPAGGAMPPAALMAPASKDPLQAPAGAYRIDLDHSAVIARVGHRGMSFNVLRFGVRNGALQWDPSHPSGIAIDATIDAKPYYAPIVYTIPPEGPQSLDVAQFPDARFVSTSVEPVGPTRAKINGRLTLMGVTKPATIDAEMVGVGRSMQGAPTVGFTGTMQVDSAEFTSKPMARMVGKLTVILDAEFVKN